jgi:hypothetical protein
VSKDVYRGLKKEAKDVGEYFENKENQRKLKAKIASTQNYFRGANARLDEIIPQREINPKPVMKAFEPVPRGSFRPRAATTYIKKKDLLPNLF